MPHIIAASTTAMARTLRHRIFEPESTHRTDPSSGMPWRSVVLICLAIIAAVFASYSLIVDPPDTAREPASYLP